LKVEIHEYITQRGTGDRAIKMEDCSNFELWLIKDGTSLFILEKDCNELIANEGE